MAEDCMYEQLQYTPNWAEAPDWPTHYGTCEEWKKGATFWYNDKFYCYNDEAGLYEGEKFKFGEKDHISSEDMMKCLFSRPVSGYYQKLKEMLHNSQGNAESQLVYPETSSIDLLNQVKSIQEQRAAEYEQDGGERSFDKIAGIFNTLRGTELLPSDIALILSILKDVRFYSQDGLHMDSVIDKVSYSSLWAELVIKERDNI